MPEPTAQTSPPPRPPHPPSQENQQQHHQQPRRKRFRFKSPSRPSSKPNPNPKDPHEKETRHTAHRARRAHRNRHRTPKTPETPDPASTPLAQLDPDTAFRESLFDALGDDEGATYWESVYGQPIHTYAVPSMPTGPAGELEQMDEEEYAAYVRSKMWERTREGMLEEQARLRAERDRKRRQEKTQRQAGENARRAFDEAIEASLRRGRERKRERAWKEAWEAYRGCWGRLDGAVAAAAAAAAGKQLGKEEEGEGGDKGAKGSFRNLVFWPVDSGKRRDVSKENVEGFMRHSPQAANGPSELLAVLKAERVRWHPDKIQQRYGVLGIEEAVLRSVTEVFQIIDHLWNDLRTKESA